MIEFALLAGGREGMKRRTRHGSLILRIALSIGFAFSSAAEPLEPDSVPEPLQPWIEWVLRGHEERACPFLNFANSSKP